ncbi:MAG: rhodanese-like domain-containing protein [Ferruginibacter sp.]
MKKLYILFYIAGLTITGFAQYKNDNVLYKTVYTQDLCNELSSHPGYLLIDVRTPGEYADTSSRGLNLGRFKNAVNIEVLELGNRISEISNYKYKPVFVYCSHSQRSRRASKMLADSGFTQVFNINGGMTGLRQLPLEGNNCLYDKLETQNTYNIISAADLCTKISNNAKKILLLDVRNDSAFKHISLDAKINSFGYFKNSMHIPLADLETNILKVPAGREIIIIDLFGGEAAKAAELLKRNNYSNVSVLLEGLDAVNSTDRKTLACLPSAYISNLSYKIINAQELKSFLETTNEYLFLDARTTEEFTNKHKNYWQNIGHLENAVNIPSTDLEAQWNKIEGYKTKPVIVYVFGSGTVAHEVANTLVKKGFINVMVLQGGLFNIGWTAANVKGFSSLAKLRVDVPERD